jgi:hypothetical protein
MMEYPYNYVPIRIKSLIIITALNIKSLLTSPAYRPGRL